MEKKLRPQIVEQITLAKSKVAGPKDWINSFDHCEVEIFFYISPDDPAYSEESDNIIVVLIGYFTDTDIYWIDDGQNHKDHGMYEITTSNFHCSTFHALYDHTDLSLDEILRISSFDVNIQTRITHEVEV